MKRPLERSDSMDPFVQICQTTTEEIKPSQKFNTDFHYAGAGGDFPSIMEGLEDEEFSEAATVGGEKKRRLTVRQVKALEKNFEIEKKPEPDRKLELARELGLQPRQVAVWFQNRRARWKTKLLERDYGSLKAEHDALKLAHDALLRHNQALFQEIQELKEKLKEEETTVNINVSAVKQEEDDNSFPAAIKRLIPPPPPPLPPSDLEYETFDLFPDGLGDAGPSDSDSSAVLNDGSPTAANITTSGCFFGEILKIEEIGKLFDDHDEQWYCSMT